jgi:hypothetical protein
MPKFIDGVFAPFFSGGGVAGAPFAPGNGKVFYVDGANGSDNYGGTTPQTAFKTLDVAYGACAGDMNEIIYALGSAGTSINFSSAITSGSTGLVWSKNSTHLIGLGVPTAVGQRAHISNGASTKLYTPLITVSGRGNLFQNVELFNGGNHATQAAVCLLVTGDNNAFVNCQISGGGHTTSATNSAMRSLVVGSATGPVQADENFFYHCYIGLDTVSRNTTSAEIEFVATAQNARCSFEACTFTTYSSSATTLLVKVGATSIDRHLVFKDCLFLNPSTFSGGAITSQALACDANPGGIVMLHNCLSAGAASFTKFQTTASTAVFGDNPGSAASTYGVAATS